jgi:hypothetical protein
MGYQSAVNMPTASQLVPVANSLNPLSVFYGNRALKPEQSHDVYLTWLLFDQFSFTTFFTSLSAGFTKDKINWSRTVNDSLGQSNTLVNVPEDYNITGHLDFSTPIRKLGVTIHASLRENWNRGISLVNGIENTNTNLGHRLTLSIDNRKKEKWDINVGGTLRLTDARYSLYSSLNNRYYDWTAFAELRFNPNDRWSFETTADITSYNERSFGSGVSIPLIGAEINHHFLKNKRGTITISAFDILNKNKSINRISELNYLRETRSNVIGRYALLTFKYRLNKFESHGNGISVSMGRH